MNNLNMSAKNRGLPQKQDPGAAKRRDLGEFRKTIIERTNTMNCFSN